MRALPGAGGQPREEVHQFKTTVGGLLVLRDWLKAHGVTHVAMEATGVYWKPVWAILEDDFESAVGQRAGGEEPPWPQDRCQGRRVALPAAGGRAAAGELRAAEADPREARSSPAIAPRKIKERQREANRLHKALEPSGIKLDCVATDILGKSGRDMLDALCSGTTDPEVLAEAGQGQAAQEDPALEGGAPGPLRRLLGAADRRDPRAPGLPR